MRFELAHEVTLDRPVAEVFPALALPDGLEPLLRLSPMVTSFRLLGAREGATPSTEVVDFEFGERVTMLAGLYTAEMTMRVEQTVDHEALRVDYRSRAKAGVPIRVHKVRTFAPSGTGTTVSEVVHGEAPPGVHLLAARTARRAHVEHMESYGRLFAG